MDLLGPTTVEIEIRTECVGETGGTALPRYCWIQEASCFLQYGYISQITWLDISHNLGISQWSSSELAKKSRSDHRHKLPRLNRRALPRVLVLRMNEGNMNSTHDEALVDIRCLTYPGSIESHARIYGPSKSRLAGRDQLEPGQFLLTPKRDSRG